MVRPDIVHQVNIARANSPLLQYIQALHWSNAASVTLGRINGLGNQINEPYSDEMEQARKALSELSTIIVLRIEMVEKQVCERHGGNWPKDITE
jgi:hypothetical protein